MVAGDSRAPVKSAQSGGPSAGKNLHTLTRNQAVVLEALTRNGKPMKAYAILEDVKDNGVRAPMTVYRALDDLIDRGLVCKLDSIKAYSLCPGDVGDVPVFLVCDTCGKSVRVSDPELEKAAQALLDNNAFQSDRLRIELTAHCCSK